MSKQFITSESVSEGHPDKICDQISDAVLDAVLKDDPNGACCCETFVTRWMVMVGWEITTKTYVDIPKIVRETLTNIGYTNSDYGIDAQTCAVLNVVQEQSADIAQWEKLGEGKHEGQWAGDQGMMFGYACNDTEELMPMPITIAHKLVKKLAEVRKSWQFSYLRPDAKSQVTVEYNDDKPTRVDAIVIASQHDEDVTLEQIRKDIKEFVITPICGDLIDENTKFYINETWRFVVWGPQWDTWLTWRKIIVDTYGWVGRHGGGAFSGKVPNKQDRSWAYMARYVSKNIVAAGLAERCELQLAYAIWFPQPVSIHINAFWTAKLSESEIEEIVRKEFDLSPAGIIDGLDLKRPIYKATAAYGHFGRSEFPWENLNKVEDLKKYL